MKIEEIELKKIEAGYNPRTIFDLIDLKKSIQQHGLLEPLIVRPFGEKFILVAGERRWKVCKELNIKKVFCHIKELNDEDAENLAYVDNEDRDNLSPIEKAKHFAHMRDTYGYTAQKIADKYGVSKGRVGELWGIAELPFVPMLEHLARQHLYEISKIVSKKELAKVFEKAFDIKQEEWTEEQIKTFEKELDLRQGEQLKLATKIYSQELSVKETQKEVKNILYDLEEKDKQIMLKAKEQVSNAIASFEKNSSDINNSLKTFSDRFKSFQSNTSFFTTELVKRMSDKDKKKIIAEIDELKKNVREIKIEDLSKTIDEFKKIII